MSDHKDFTQGKLLGPFLLFSIPIIFALFLQSMYGAIDLLVVGRFSAPSEVSAVSTGSQVMTMLTSLTSSLAMGITVFLSEKIGEKKGEEGGRIVGNGIFLFLIFGIILTAVITLAASPISSLMNAPAEAFSSTVKYLRICGCGCIVIILYNLIGSIFRGIGDSKTPLITVFIAACFNIAGDLILVAGFHLGAAGAAIATVAAQLISVIISWKMIQKKALPFTFQWKYLKPVRFILKKILAIGTPISLQDLLVSLSFLIILAIVNAIGVVASAGVGIGEKVVIFLIMIPISFMQSMAVFVAQNRGARCLDRAWLILRYASGVAFLFGVAMFVLAFFFGDKLAALFVSDPAIIAAAFEYLKSYGIDCLLTCFMFILIGFLNGMEMTRFVMIQGILGAFFVRVPISFLMSRQEPVSLFHIGLATPASSAVQIVICLIALLWLRKKINAEKTGASTKSRT
jgi:putative MATE family efflux protein